LPILQAQQRISHLPASDELPIAFPLLVERLSSRLSNESLLDRIERLKQQWQNK